MSPAPVHAAESLETVLCRAGGCLFGLEAARVRGAVAVAAPTPEGADPTLANCLGLPPEDPDPMVTRIRHALILRGARRDWRLTLDGPIELAAVPADAIRPLPPLLAACPHPRGLRALAFFRRELLLLLDADWLEHEV